MNLSKAASIILASTLSVKAFVPTSMKNGAVRSSLQPQVFVPTALKMADGAVIDAEAVTDVDEGEKFE